MGSIGTWIVAILLTAIIVWIIWKLKSDKKKGKSSCGSNCGCCPNSQMCHSIPKKEFK